MPGQPDPYATALEGCGREVIQRLMALARKRSLPVEEAFWGSGRLVSNRVSQTLTVRGEGASVQAVFDEQWLLDCRVAASRDAVQQALTDLLDRFAQESGAPGA